MRSLNEVKEELKRLNEEDKNSPIFNFDTNEIYYPKVNKVETKENIEYWARYYILIHYNAKVQDKYWSKYEFPLDKNTTREDWDNRNTERWYEYQKIMSNWEHDKELIKQEKKRIKEEWWPY